MGRSLAYQDTFLGGDPGWEQFQVHNIQTNWTN